MDIYQLLQKLPSSNYSRTMAILCPHAHLLTALFQLFQLTGDECRISSNGEFPQCAIKSDITLF